MLDEVHPRKTHDLLDFSPVAGGIALSLAVLAHRLRILRAGKAFPNPVLKQFQAVGTK